MAPRTVFLGTPEFAVPSLEAVDELNGQGVLSLVAVVTQPDRPGDRGRVAVPPVKERGLHLGLRVLQPERLRDAGLDAVLALEPELLVWAAYGNLIPRALLDAARGRAVNVHASLLPRWRGAAPVAHAILAGDDETGITLMEGTAELDAGPILAQERVHIDPTESAGELAERLARVGGTLLRRELPRYIGGELRGRPQDPLRVTVAPKLTTRDGELDWSQPAESVARRVRAMTPSPGAWTTLGGQRVGVLAATVLGGPPREHGTLLLGRRDPAYAPYWGQSRAPHVACGAGWLRLDEVRPAGKRAMSGDDWANGLRALGEVRLPS
ncbi:MAG TPA: methionyl-tRNA formyltransferase [Candidatus Limnocylindria bacterium]|nr:methionyl-tRNA formyltransferase [Candidatus Limnocylindria bacterium]